MDPHIVLPNGPKKLNPTQNREAISCEKWDVKGTLLQQWNV